MGQQLRLRLSTSPEKRTFWTGYLWERLWTDSEERMADSLGVPVKNGHQRYNKKKKRKNRTEQNSIRMRNRPDGS